MKWGTALLGVNSECKVELRPQVRHSRFVVKRIPAKRSEKKPRGSASGKPLDLNKQNSGKAMDRKPTKS